LNALAQEPSKIKFKKENQFYFFQKGLPNDSIIRDVSDKFYLVVPDSLKPLLSIQADNGQLTSTANDSIVKLGHFPGLKYETIFIPIDEITGEKKINKYKIKTMINGTSELPRNRIRIVIINKRTGEVLLTNTFFSSGK
jgi:hypothetical protein